MTIKLPALALETAIPQWRDGELYSSRYADGYFGSRSAAAESRHVFLSGNGLPQAWEGASRFTVGELGFGAGLNFCLTREIWNESRQPGQTLHYVAVEAHPFVAADLGRVHDSLAIRNGEELVERWPIPVGGTHRLAWRSEQLFLTLLFGDAAAQLAELEARVNAWYLDGFAPSRNADMWSESVVREMARLSVPGATFATYSSAGAVRARLSAAGFDCRKVPGFGRKREMTVGQFGGLKHRQSLPSWAQTVPTNPEAITIVGAGIAGASLAYSIAARGSDVRVIEASNAIAGGASSVGTALIGPRLAAKQSLESRLTVAGWLHAVATFDTLGLGPRSGLLRVDADTQRLRSMAMDWPLTQLGAQPVTAAIASKRSGVTLDAPATYWQRGGLINTRAIVETLMATTPVQFDSSWKQAKDDETVLFAHGISASRELGTAHLPLRARLGQVTYVRATAESQSLALPVAYGGYITPALNGLHEVGASFDHLHRRDWTKAQPLQSSADTHNLGNLRLAIPTLKGISETNVSGGWTGIRAVTPDHVPLAGPINLEKNLWGLLGLGSYGFSLAPLLAELVAAQLFGEPWPLPRRLALAALPNRFEARARRRQS